MHSLFKRIACFICLIALLVNSCLVYADTFGVLYIIDAHKASESLYEADLEIPGASFTLHIEYHGNLPSGAKFRALVPEADSKNYEETALEMVERSQGGAGRASLLGFLDLGLYIDGECVEPDGDVEISVVFPDEIEGEVYAVHFPGTGESHLEIDQSFVDPDSDVVEVLDEVDEPETGPLVEVDGLEEDTLTEADALEADALSETVVGEEGLLDAVELVDDAMEEDGPVIEAAELITTTVNGNVASFTASSFSYYAIVSYTVDFHYNGYEFSIKGGDAITLSELVQILGLDVDLAEVVDITFSDESLVWVGYVEEKASLGAIKERYRLEVEYSTALDQEEIEKINEREIGAGEWVLLSLRPFTTDESLTITLSDGEVINIKVTDAVLTSLNQIDSTKEYVIYYKYGDNYYVLNTSGGTEVKTADQLDYLDNNYKWIISYIYTNGEGKSYYHIFPRTDENQTLALNWYLEPLVKDGRDNNVTITRSGGGFVFEGYNSSSLHLTSGGNFIGAYTGMFSLISPTPVQIYEQNPISKYDFYVVTDDYSMGTVSGYDKNNTYYTEWDHFDATTNNNKYNNNDIIAMPKTNRYIFDYWDLNGTRLENTATIAAGTLAIPFTGSRLTAHFKKDPNWEASDEEKEGRVIDRESFQRWLAELRARNIPLNDDGCTKTAELYDYENRVYRVDMTAQSNLSMFNGDIDLGFIIDVSGSMQFPSKLIPVAGKEAVDVFHINDNYTTQHQLDTSKVYYLIVDRTNRADVLRLKWNDGPNPARPNHNGWPTGNPDSSSTSWHTGWGICGHGYETEAELDAATRYLTTAGSALFNDDDGPFQIYTAGDNGKRRREYLESSLAGTISEMKTILGDLAYAADSSEAADVKVAYNTFAAAVDYNHTNHEFVSVTDDGLSIGYDYKGGTSTWLALQDALDFDWDSSSTKVAILITDGAPQESGTDGTTLDNRVKTAAENLKASNGGITLVTVGLSMGDVKRGSRLLYDIATKDSDGDAYFYKAETGDELQYVLYEIIQHVMTEAIVVGEVTDPINEAFYPVDKTTGRPLETGEKINLKGEVTTDTSQPYGTIVKTGNDYKVVWDGQSFTWDGWHGTVYVKAKEDFLGGNAVRTNDGDASIVSKGYKIKEEDSTINFKSEVVQQGTRSLATPRVNVNELNFTETNTEWTVYLGQEVDPLSQVKKLFDNIKVEEVVKRASDSNNDGFSDRVVSASDYRFTLEESMSDQRSAATEKVTFNLKNLVTLTDPQWTEIIEQSELPLKENKGVTIPYDKYGQDCPGTINIKLIKDNDVNIHETDKEGTPAETYKLLVEFSPDYDSVPAGQGGKSGKIKEFHTGNYGLGYQGHAAGTDTSTNTHIINVFTDGFSFTKTEMGNDSVKLKGAKFRLYRKVGEDEFLPLEKINDYIFYENDYYKLVDDEEENAIDIEPIDGQYYWKLSDDVYTVYDGKAYIKVPEDTAGATKLKYTTEEYYKELVASVDYDIVKSGIYYKEVSAGTSGAVKLDDDKWYVQVLVDVVVNEVGYRQVSSGTTGAVQLKLDTDGYYKETNVDKISNGYAYNKVEDTFVEMIDVRKIGYDYYWKLNGSEYTVDSEGRILKEDTNGTIKISGKKYSIIADVEYISDSSGKVDIPSIRVSDFDMVEDVYVYYLKETGAPDGYYTIPISIPVKIKIDDKYDDLPSDGQYNDNRNETILQNWKQFTTVTLDTTSGGYVEQTQDGEYLVRNNPGAELPATGGITTMPVYLLGILLTAFASIMLLMRRRVDI